MDLVDVMMAQTRAKNAKLYAQIVLEEEGFGGYAEAVRMGSLTAQRALREITTPDPLFPDLVRTAAAGKFLAALDIAEFWEV